MINVKRERRIHIYNKSHIMNNDFTMYFNNYIEQHEAMKE